MNILKKIGLICCAVLIGLGAILLPRTANLQSYIAKADNIDTSYTFNGSTIWVPFTPYQNGSPVGTSSGGYATIFGNFNFSISKPTSTSLKLQMSGGGNMGTSYYRYAFNETRSITSETGVDISYTLLASGGNTTQYVHFWISSDNFSDFVPNIYKIYEWYSWDSAYYIGGNHIRYYDINEHYLDISITCWFKPVGVYSGYTDTPFGMSPRTYYLYSLDDFSDNQMFNQGYQEGIETASNNNFFTLIGAAVDVPITALTSLLNFTFLGVNLLAFVTSILTLALIIFVIKKFMGKG